MARKVLVKKVPYKDTFDSEAQIDAEEMIASKIFDSPRLSEEECAQLGRDILYLVLRNFRPDLFEERNAP